MAMHSLDAEFIFREGREQERSVLRLLDDAGIEVFEQQRPFEWKILKLTGHTDGKVMFPDRPKPLPLEIKSMAPWIWEKINTVQDMIHSGYHWVQKYPPQLTLYMMMDEVDEALFLLKNKSTGKLKEVLITLDFNYAESLVQKIEEVNRCVDNHLTPPPIEWGTCCEKCGFNHICIREVNQKEIEFREDPEAEEKLDGWFELKQWHEQWKELDEWRKGYFRGVEKMVVGPYLITGKKVGTDGWKISVTKV